MQRRGVHICPEAKAEGDAVEECCRLMPLAAVGGPCGEQRRGAAGEVRLLQAAHLVSVVGVAGGVGVAGVGVGVAGVAYYT